MNGSFSVRPKPDAGESHTHHGESASSYVSITMPRRSSSMTGSRLRYHPDSISQSPRRLVSIGGRGLLLIRTFMDEVAFNADGNLITMVKRFQTPLQTASELSDLRGCLEGGDHEQPVKVRA